MYVEHLSLTDFRNYCAAEVPLDAGVTVFVGSNGQGKTNLVEAVEYLSTLGSHRVATDAPLIRLDAPTAILRARVRAGLDDTRTLLLEVELNHGKANRIRINKAALPRPRDLLGVLRTVVFSPEDLAIVKGEPSDRRRFIDELVTARWPRMASVRSDYDKVLRQRNSLLRQLAEHRGGSGPQDSASTLEVWNDSLARIGAELLSARLDTLAELVPLVSRAYESIAPVNNQARADYRSTLDLSGSDGVLPDRATLESRLRDAMTERRREELARGVSLVGPHRDDITLSIGPLPAKGYASHGESWSLALALRLGGFTLLREDGVEPVLVLDDVFAELDQTRRERLAAGVVDAEQVLVTAAVEADVPALLVGRRYRVDGGRVDPVDPVAPVEEVT